MMTGSVCIIQTVTGCDVVMNDWLCLCHNSWHCDSQRDRGSVWCVTRLGSESQLYNFSWSSVPTLGPRCSTSPSHLKISLSRWTGRALSVLSGQTGLITPHTNTKILTRTCSNFGYYWENHNWFSKMSTWDYGPSLFDALLACELCLCCESIVPENSPIFSCSGPKSSLRD